MRFYFDVSNLNKNNKLLKFILIHIHTKLFDQHNIAVQYHIQDISDIRPTVDRRKPTLSGNNIYIELRGQHVIIGNI